MPMQAQPPPSHALKPRLALALAAAFYAAVLLLGLVPAVRADLYDAGVIWWLYTVTVLLYGALTLLLLATRPGDPRAALFTVVGVFVAVSLLLDVVPERVAASPLLYPYLALYACTYGLVWPVILHMAASIPARNPLLDRYPRLLPAAYALGALTALFLFGTLLHNFHPWLPAGWTEETVSRANAVVNRVGYAVATLGGLALLGHAARREPTPEGRRQAFLVFAGLIPYTANNLASLAVLRLHDMPGYWIWEAVVILLVPIAFAVSILRYRLFEVGVVVRRGLIYALTGSLAAAVLYLAVAAASAATGATRWGEAAAFLLAGALFHPLLRRVAGAVDRRFFPEKVALHGLRDSIIPELAGFGAAEEMAAHLARRLRDAVDARSAALLLADGGGSVYRLAAWAGPAPAEARSRVLPADALAPWSARLGAGRAIDRAEEPAPGDEAARVLDALEARWVVPVKVKETLVGLVALGEPRQGRGLEREDLQALEAVARQASAMLENARLFDLATRDPLTRLPRRQPAMERLAEEVERGRRTFSPFAVALADVDGFKAVNDARGHHAGDAVLAGVAAILARESRRVDVVARWGGEEFLLLMPDTPPEGAHAHADALRRRVAGTPVRCGDAPDDTVRVTLTIGLCAVASPADLADAEELVRRADAALYHGKRAGKDRVETALSALAP